METVKLTVGEPDADDLVTTDEAARVLGLSTDTLRWREREGRLPTQRTTNGVRLTSNEGARVPRERARRGT